LLDSPRSPDDCRRALESETSKFWGKPILRGLLPKADGMVLRVRHTMLRNSFEMLADVRLRPGGRGTQVEITLRSHYFAAAFITLWLGFTVLFAVGGFGPLLTGTGGSQDWTVMPFLLFFPIFGFGFIAFGRLLARRDGSTLLEFIARVTDGQRYPDALLPPM
jgi:hypothetical protein